MSSVEGSTKVVVFALIANLGIALAKFFGAFLTGSAALFAEGVHSLVDCTNQALLLFGSRQAKRPVTTKHPLGHGREAFFWSFMVAILLFTLGGVFAIFEGVHKFSDPEALSSPLVGFSILLVSLVLEGFSFAACLKEIRAQNPYGSLWRWFQKTTSSEVLVVFTEDLAAMLGLILAAIFLGLSAYTGQSTWDAIGSIAVGVLLVVVAFTLAIEIKSLIIGEAPETDFRSFVEERVAKLIPGGRVLHLIALQTGSREVMLSCKLHPGTVTDVSALIDSINQIERETKQRFPEVRWQFFEPDTAD